MQDTFRLILEIAHEYYGNCLFLILSIVSGLYLFFAEKDIRRKWLWPIILMMLITINPILYKKIFYRIIYWRLYWMFPDAVIISLALTHIIKNIKFAWIRYIVLLCFVILVAIKGDFVYNKKDFEFVDNAWKVSGEVKKICDYIETQDKELTCIFPPGLYCEVRQYNGKIKQRFGRDAEGYIIAADDYIRNLSTVLWNDSDENMEIVFRDAFENEINFVVTFKDKYVSLETLEAYGYSLVNEIDNYKIYMNQR